MNSRDDYLLLTRLSTSAATPSAEQAPAPSASPPSGAGAVPLECGIFFCGQPATNGDLCQHHFDLAADIRSEWESLRAEYEGDGWD